MNYSLGKGWDLFLSTKNTILKVNVTVVQWLFEIILKLHHFLLFATFVLVLVASVEFHTFSTKCKLPILRELADELFWGSDVFYVRALFFFGRTLVIAC